MDKSKKEEKEKKQVFRHGKKEMDKIIFQNKLKPPEVQNIRSLAPNFEHPVSNLQPSVPNSRHIVPNLRRPFFVPNFEHPVSNLQPSVPNSRPVVSNLQRPLAPHIQPVALNYRPNAPNIQYKTPNIWPMAPINLPILSNYVTPFFYELLATHISNLSCQFNEYNFYLDVIARSFPIDGYKHFILSSVKENKVAIISAGIYYSLNEVLLCFLDTLLGLNNMIICCEPSDTATIIVAERCRKLLTNSPLSNKIGYKTKDSTDYNRNTKILFISESQLFYESIRNPTFTNYSVILFHCELQRSIETNLLLDCLGKCVAVRKDFKLVLLLSTLDNSLIYKNYFSKFSKVHMTVVQNLNSKVKILWKNSSFSSNKNYMNDVVDTILAVHTFNKPGDILVFLPTASDITKTKILLSSMGKKHSLFRNISCFPIYLDSTEICFPKRKNANRNIFLTASNIESILLPSVCYVIDTGIKRDLYYNTEKSTYMFKHTFISQSRAKLRKIYASYFNTSAICYRLYSKDDYITKMPKLEILLKDPCYVMIQTFHYNSTNAMSLDFIDYFPAKQKEQALTILKANNIINENGLELFGQLILKLPYRYEYSKLIVIGYQWGLCLEAIILVAFFLEKASIFLHENDDDDELKSKIEASKFHYNYCDSDTLTNLNIYYDWIFNDCSQIWCKQKAFDYNTLVDLQNRVKSIISVVEEQLETEVNCALKSKNEHNWTGLQEMLYTCFKQNLCIYTGHYRSGYCMLHSNCITFFHPSSNILQKSNLPKYIVYDYLKLTSRYFMMGVTSVPEDFILSDIKKGVLKVNELQLSTASLKPIVMNNIGIMSIKRVLLGKKGKKLLQIEDQIKEKLKCNLVVIDPSEEKGTVTLYVPQEHADNVENIIRNIIQAELESILNTKETVILELKHGPTSIQLNLTIEKGAIISNINATSLNLNAVQKSNSTTAKNSTVKFSINLTWMRRTCVGVGYAAFKNSRDFFIARKLCTKSVLINGKYASILLDKKHENQFFIKGLPLETTNNDLLSSVNNALKILPTEVQAQTAFVLYECAFETSEDECLFIRDKLFHVCSELLQTKDIDVIIPKPKNEAIIMKAYINLTVECDKSKINSLNKRLKIDSYSVKAHPVYYVTFFCSENIHAVSKEIIESKFTAFRQKVRSVYNRSVSDDEIFKYKEEKLDNSSFICLKLLANNLDFLTMVQRIILTVLNGVHITCQDFKNLPKLFNHCGHLWLKDLQTHLKIHIIEEYKTKSLRLYGSPKGIVYVLQQIKKYLSAAENEIIKVVDLSLKDHSRVLVQRVIKTYGIQLDRFVELFHLRSAIINIRDSKLELHGSAANIEKAVSEIEHLVQTCSLVAKEELVLAQEVCCTCGIPPFQTYFRLEHCGHLYCAQCINGLITCTEFPISCCADDCNKELILEDIRQALNYDDDEIKDLLHRSFMDFISRNKDQFAYCPAADCSYFYNKKQVNNNWTCELCQNEICIKCNAVFHHGYTCEMYQESKKDPDYSLKVWMKEDESIRKACPKCHIKIEKNGGCNHMACGHCKAHFCWLCTNLFSDAQSVYDHQPFCLKGYHR